MLVIIIQDFNFVSIFNIIQYYTDCLAKWAIYIDIQLFNSLTYTYCIATHQRLIKKDIDDSSDPELMAEFFSKLVIAYQEPASSPLDHSTNCDSETYPLLSSTQFWSLSGI